MELFKYGIIWHDGGSVALIVCLYDYVPRKEETATPFADGYQWRS